MNRKVSAAEKLLGRWARMLGLVSGFVLPVLMLLIVADITLRFFVNAPVKGTLEISEYSLLIVVFFALSYTQTQKGHVASDMLAERFSRRVWSIKDILLGFAVLVVFALFFYAALDSGMNDLRSNITTTLLFVPLFLFKFGMGLGLLVLWLVLLLEWIQTLG